MLFEFLNITRPVWLSVLLILIVYLVISNLYNLAKKLGDYLEE